VILEPELIRSILDHVETQSGHSSVTGFRSFTDEAIVEHRRLLIGTGYIDESAAWSSGQHNGMSLQLTWKGQDFLEASRDGAVWDKAKDLVRDKGISLAPSFRLDILNGVLMGLASDAVREMRLACRS